MMPQGKLTPAQQQVVLQNQRLVWMMARRLAGKMFARCGRTAVGGKAWMLFNQYVEEFLDLGMIALCRASMGFDATRGIKFSTYAGDCIRNEMLRHLCEASLDVGPKSFRSQNRKMVGLICERHTFDQTGGSADGFDVSDREEYQEIDDRPSRELCVLLSLFLDYREYHMVVARSFHNKTLQEIGDENGITKERTRQLLDRAFGKLRDSGTFMRALDLRIKRKRREEITYRKDGLGKIVA